MFGSFAIGIGIGTIFTGNQGAGGIIGPASKLQLEDAFFFLQEDGVSFILLQ